MYPEFHVPEGRHACDHFSTIPAGGRRACTTCTTAQGTPLYFCDGCIFLPNNHPSSPPRAHGASTARGSQEVAALDQQLHAALGPAWSLRSQPPGSGANKVDPTICKREQHAMAAGAWGPCDGCSAPAAGARCTPCSAALFREIKFCTNCLNTNNIGTPHGYAEAPTGVETGMYRYGPFEHNPIGTSSSTVGHCAGINPNAHTHYPPQPSSRTMKYLLFAIVVVPTSN